MLKYFLIFIFCTLTKFNYNSEKKNILNHQRPILHHLSEQELAEFTVYNNYYVNACRNRRRNQCPANNDVSFYFECIRTLIQEAEKRFNEKKQLKLK